MYSTRCALLCSLPHCCLRDCVRRLQDRGQDLDWRRSGRPSSSLCIRTHFFGLLLLSVIFDPSAPTHVLLLPIDCNEYNLCLRSRPYHLLLHPLWRALLGMARWLASPQCVPQCRHSQCLCGDTTRGRTERACPGRQQRPVGSCCRC